MTIKNADESPYGADALHLWFGLSYASFLTLPRSFMQAMPDDWQGRMAQLLNEWDEHWDSDNHPPEQLIVSAKINNKFTSMPSWLKDYRLWRPDKINACFASKHIKNGATNEQV